MDISLKHENYKFLNKMAENILEETIESDMSLPEYMPEILRIIRTTATPKISSCRLSGDRVTVDGVCELRMLYTAEDGGLYAYTHTQPFTKYCENDVYAEAIDVTSRAFVSFVNCRATNNRRAEIKAGISVKVCAFGEVCNDIISSAEGDGLEQKLIPVDAMSLGCRKTKRFSMSDSVQPQTPASAVVSVSASAVCTDIRKINNKLMIKGEAVVRICYVKDKEKTSTDIIKHTIPINQIMEFEGMEERFTGNVVLNVCSADVMPKGESSDGITSFDISLGVDVSITMWDLKSMLVISDAYGVGKSLELKHSSNKYYCALNEIRDTVIAEESFAAPSDGVSCILDCCGDVISQGFKQEDGKATISGSINLSMIIKDGNGNLNNIIKTLDYCYSNAIDTDDKNIVCDPSVSLVSLDCALSSGGIAVRAEVSVTGTVFEEKMINTVTDIKVSESQDTRKRHAITVYFPESEESLWSIARRYNTTVNAIAEENNLQGETTENLKILFIPAV